MEQKSKNTFYLDTEYVNFIPRKSRLKYSTVGKGYLFVAGMLLLVAFFGCMAAGYLSIAYSGVRDFWRFNLKGVETLAAISDCEIFGYGKYEWLEITYSYTVENVVYDVRDSVPTRSQYNHCGQFLTGTQIGIQYYAYNPAQSRIEEYIQWSSIIPISSIILCVIALFSILTILSAGSIVFEFQARQQYHLLRREGILLYGEVIKAEYEKGSRKGGSYYILKITTEFETPDGRLISRVFEGKTENFISRVIPSAGTPVKLLYANEHAVIML